VTVITNSPVETLTHKMGIKARTHVIGVKGSPRPTWISGYQLKLYVKMFWYGWPGQQLNALFLWAYFFYIIVFLFYKPSNGNYLMSKCDCYNLVIYVWFNVLFFIQLYVVQHNMTRMLIHAVTMYWVLLAIGHVVGQRLTTQSSTPVVEENWIPMDGVLVVGQRLTTQSSTPVVEE